MERDAARVLLTNLALARAEVDRGAHLRADPDRMGEAARDPRARVLQIWQGRFPVERQDRGVVPAWAPMAEDSDGLYLLGLGVDGAAYFADHRPHESDAGGHAVPRGQLSNLRDAGEGMDPTDAGLLAAAVALTNWHESHGYCPACGSASVPSAAGWARTCVAEGRELYPRTDPSVIVLVRDSSDRALLGRKAEWPTGWFSTLAGFIEAGESAESAVRREVMEEAGVAVADMAYLGSQPWPFPGSLMLGYHAWSQADGDPEVDGIEISEARWFTRAELVAGCRDGSVRIPPAVSIARRLIERWFGEELPGEWSRR